MNYAITILLTVVLFFLLGMKWQIDRKLAFSWSVFLAALGCLTTKWISNAFPDLPFIAVLGIALLQSAAVSALAILYFFYRDPERACECNENEIVCPADGKVVYIKEIKNGEFPFAVKNSKKIPLNEFTQAGIAFQNGVQIGISMNFLDVHVNRAPITGKISTLKRIPGEFKSLRKIKSLLENERVITVIDGDGTNVGVVQIASRLVRRIVPFVSAGDAIAKGAKLGAIRFGSQVDVLIPAGSKTRILVEENQIVKAGVTIIATF